MSTERLRPVRRRSNGKRTEEKAGINVKIRSQIQRQNRPPKKQKQAAATMAGSKESSEATSKTKAAAGYRCWPAAALKAESWLQCLRSGLRMHRRLWRRRIWRRRWSCAVATTVAVLRRVITVGLIGGRSRRRISIRAGLRIHARWTRMQREVNAAARVFVHSALQIKLVHVQRALTAVIHGVVQHAILQPVVAGGVGGAVLQIEQHGGPRCRDVARVRVVVGRALRFGYSAGIVRSHGSRVVIAVIVVHRAIV